MLLDLDMQLMIRSCKKKHTICKQCRFSNLHFFSEFSPMLVNIAQVIHTYLRENSCRVISDKAFLDKSKRALSLVVDLTDNLNCSN